MVTITDPCTNCTRGRAIRRDGDVVGYESICTGKCYAKPDTTQTYSVPSGDSFVRKAIQEKNKK